MGKPVYVSVDKLPTKQGPYEVQFADGSVTLAELRIASKKEGKQWFAAKTSSAAAHAASAPLQGVTGWRSVTPHEIAEARRLAMTPADHIAAALEHFKKHNDIRFDAAGLPPACRALNVGDSLELGHLRDCKVVEVHEDGQVVVLTYHDIKRVYGAEVDNGICYRAAHWTQVVPTAGNRSDNLVREPVMHNAWQTVSLSELLARVGFGMDDNPDYQRDYTWTAADKEALLDSLCNAREIGRFLIVVNKYPKLDEVLDGKQRLSCLWEFFTSRIAYKGNYWHNLTPWDRRHIEAKIVQLVELKSENVSRADLLRAFLEVNVAGVPQTEEHLQKVRDLLAQEIAKETAVPA